MKHTLIKLPVLCMLMLTAAAGCKKKTTDTPTNTSDCNKENFGIIIVNYGKTTEKHAITVTFPDLSFRSKTTGKGLASDTMHISPGTCQVNVASVNDAGQALEQTNFNNVSINQCKETTFGTGF
jgi:hypothetical protein